jgi:F420-dependent oxidoreductase-like protein
MRLGIRADEQSFARFEDFAAWIDGLAAGWDSVWLGAHQSWDPLSLVTAVGRQRPDLSYGSGVALTYPQHPVALAMQALTAQAATGGRFTLGLGTGHRNVIERVYGYPADRPAQHVREYLTVLCPLLRGEQVDYRGQTLVVSGAVTVPGISAPHLLLAALGPVLLRLAGSLADGTILSWATPRAVAQYVAPLITKAAAEAGRPAPEIIAMVPVCIDENASELRAWAAGRFAGSAALPNYQAILDRGGAKDITDAMALGPEAVVTAQLGRLAEAGATGIVAMPVGSSDQIDRTVSALASWGGP